MGADFVLKSVSSDASRKCTLWLCCVGAMQPNRLLLGCYSKNVQQEWGVVFEEPVLSQKCYRVSSNMYINLTVQGLARTRLNI